MENIFVKIAVYICPNFKMFVSKEKIWKKCDSKDAHAKRARGTA